MRAVLGGILVATGMVVAAGCGSDAGGQPAGTNPSGQAQTASTPTADLALERPATAAGLSEGAGGAFVRHYLSLINHAYATGDVQPLLKASDKGCLGCKGLSDYAKSANAANGGLVGDYTDRLVTVREISLAGRDRAQGTAEIRSGAYQEREAAGKPLVQQQAGTGLMDFTLSASGGNWVMYEVEIHEQD